MYHNRLTCKNTCVIALGFPPPYRDILSTVKRTRIINGRAKHKRLCHGDAAVKAFCKPQRHKIQYEMIVNHFKNPFRQNTEAVTNGRAPVKKEGKQCEKRKLNCNF